MNISLTPNAAINSASLKSQIRSPRGYVLESVLLIVIAVLFWWFVVMPKQTSISTSATQLSDLSTQESKISGAAAALQKQITELASNSQNIDELDQALPLGDNLPKINLLMQSIVASSGVTIGSLNVSGASSNSVVAGNKALLANPYGPTRTLQTYFAAMSVSGSFDQIMSLLQKLENSGRIMDITSLSINGTGPGILALQLNVNIYSLVPPS